MSPRSKAGKKEKLTEQYSAEDRAARGTELKAGSGVLSSFEGPIEESPYYKNLVRLGTEGTTRSFDDMLTAIRSRGAASGYDDMQPATGVAGATLEQERARELSKIPGESYLEATGPALTASGMRTSRANLFSEDAMGNMQLSADLENQRRARRAALWGSLVGAGSRIAGGFTPKGAGA